MYDRYQDLLTAFARAHQLDADMLAQTQELAFNGRSVGLAFEGEDHEAELVCFCDLGAPAPERAAEVFKDLLEANHFWLGTGGATLGLQASTGNVVLALRTPLALLHVDGLGALLKLFTEVASFWARQVRGEANPGSGALNFPGVAL